MLVYGLKGLPYLLVFKAAGMKKYDNFCNFEANCLFQKVKENRSWSKLSALANIIIGHLNNRAHHSHLIQTS